MVRLGTTLVRPLAGGPLWNAHAESSPSKNGMHCFAPQAQRSIAIPVARIAHMFTFGQVAHHAFARSTGPSASLQAAQEGPSRPRPSIVRMRAPLITGQRPLTHAAAIACRRDAELQVCAHARTPREPHADPIDPALAC